MAQTRPTGEQLRFRSENTGDHILDTYLESAEVGGRALNDLLEDLFDPDNSGQFRDDNFEFRFDSTADKIQFRVGQFANANSGWTDVTTFFNIRGDYNSATTYFNFDLVTLTDRDVYLVFGLSDAGTTFADEATLIASSFTQKIIDVSEARDWAKKTDGIVASTDYSAKAWAVGGTGVTNADGAAKEWATKTSGTVDGTNFSAKYWATSTDVVTVSTNIADVNTVAGDISNVNTVATDIANVNTTSTNIASVNTVAAEIGSGQDVTVVAANIASVNTAATDIANINTTAGSIANVNATGASISNVNTVAASIADVSTTATNIADINTVADEIDNNNLQTVAADIQAVIDVANDLNEATSEIDTVANSIANVNLVGTDISNVNAVAGSIANVNTTATDIANVNTVAGSIANVNLTGGSISSVNTVATDIANVNTTAGSIANVNAVGPSISNVNTVATDIANVNTTATNIADVNTVATNIANVNKVGAIDTNVTTVANNDANVTTVAGIDSDVTTVAGISANVTTVATNDANVTTVAGISADVTTVAGIDSDVTAVSTNNADVSTVATDISNVNTVAGISSNVTTVAGNDTNVTTVATNIADVNTVAGIAADVTTAATNVVDFNNRYLGPSASAPTQDPDGSALDLGDLYFDTSTNVIRVYSSAGWTTAASAVNGTADRYKYTATNSQTAFTGADDNGNTLGYDSGYLDVYLNGVRLVNGTDFTADNGTSIVLTTGASSGDIMEIVAYGTFVLANFSINEANDVNIGGGVSNGQTLVFNSSTGDFEPGDGLPSQSGNSGKYLTTDGSNPSWATVDLTTKVSKSGDSMTGNLSFGDNNKAIFGAGSDLQIYHDPSNGSFISDTGSGNLRLRGATYVILESDTGETYAQGEKDGPFYLYHNNNQKLATTSTGIGVTGTVSATAFVGDGSGLTGIAPTPASVSDQANTSTGYFDMPTGTTAQRPGTAGTGMIRFNSTLNIPEYFTGSKWLGFNEQSLIVPSEIEVTPTVFPNGGNYTTSFNDSNYYGSRILVTNGDGTVQANQYEYGLDAKFNIRSNSANDSFMQIYDWNGSSPASFNASEQNFFQVGLTWVSDVTTFAQTNSHEATSQLASGDGAWCCSKGVGSYDWFFFNGGANDNSGSAGTTNREASSLLTWSHTGSPILTIVVRGDSHPTAPRTISLYFGDTLQYTWSQTVPSGSAYLHPYVGIGYPSGNNTNWANGQPKFRYGELTDGTRFTTS